ncbi:MAG: bacteriohemerythrin [Pseudomonadota bacterium]
MALIWHSGLNTGIDVIDQQHQRIGECINNLELAIVGEDRELLNAVFEELMDYTLSHLAFEEAMMVEAGYPLATAHKAVHEQFARRIERYRQKHLAGEDVALQLHRTLNAWLIHHIKRDDMAYVPVVSARLQEKLRDARPDGWLNRMLRQVFA